MFLPYIYTFSNNKISDEHNKKLDQILNIYNNNISLPILLEYIGKKLKLNISISINFDQPIYFNEINLSNRTLKSFLNELNDRFDIHYELKENTLYIFSCQEEWKHYKIRFFYEDPLNKELDSIETADGTQQNKNKINSRSIIWDEIEKNLKAMSKKISINRYNGIISCYGYCKVQSRINEYIQIINQDLHSQITINCKVIEITTDNNNTFDITKLLNALDQQSILSKSIDFNQYVSLINSFCQSVKNLNHHIKINSSNDLQILLVSQQTGNITSTKTFFIKEQTSFANNHYQIYTPKYRRNMVLPALSANKDREFSEGFSMSVVPLILDEDNILLKIRPCIIKIQNFDTNNKPVFTKRELLTVIKTRKNQTIVLGGLNLDTKRIQINKNTKIPFFKWLFNAKSINYEKSYILILINASISADLNVENIQQ